MIEDESVQVACWMVCACTTFFFFFFFRSQFRDDMKCGGLIDAPLAAKCA